LALFDFIRFVEGDAAAYLQDYFDPVKKLLIPMRQVKLFPAQTGFIV